GGSFPDGATGRERVCRVTPSALDSSQTFVPDCTVDAADRRTLPGGNVEWGPPVPPRARPVMSPDLVRSVIRSRANADRAAQLPQIPPEPVQLPHDQRVPMAQCF